MRSSDLKHPPLVEAILEVRWLLRGAPPELPSDPNYALLVGRFFDRVHADYPTYEQLPAATIPNEMVPYLAQHRFRAKAGGWPLTQLGPGVLTLNATDGYTWTDFRRRAEGAFGALLAAYPAPDALEMTSVSLRYIDAVEFDYRSGGLFAFLAENMRVRVDLPPALFEGTTIDRNPANLSWQSTFPCRKPEGTVGLRFLTGERENKPALIWETVVGSGSASAPADPAGFRLWLDAAHQVSEDWFFKLIEGELERTFDGS